MKLLLAAFLISMHPLEEKGSEELYNLDFAQARRTFERLSREEPSAPAGPHYLAATVLMEELGRRGALTGETFQTSRYWTRSHPEPPSPAVRERFRAAVEESLRRSRLILSRRPRDREGLYFLGATEGVASAFEATLSRSYLGAYRAGKRAQKAHRELIALDPDYGDAYLVPGVYEYALATLPRTLKLLGFFIGLRGDKEEAVSLISRAAVSGARARWSARIFLAVVHQREKRYAEALALLEQAEASFPKNPLFLLEQGWVQMMRKSWKEARARFERVLARQRRGIAHYDRVAQSVVRLRLGESYLWDRRYRAALGHFEEALRSDDGGNSVSALLHVRRGQALDGLGRHEEARENYRTAVRLDADRYSRSVAERYLKTPFRLD